MFPRRKPGMRLVDLDHVVRRRSQRAATAPAKRRGNSKSWKRFGCRIKRGMSRPIFHPPRVQGGATPRWWQIASAAPWLGSLVVWQPEACASGYDSICCCRAAPVIRQLLKAVRLSTSATFAKPFRPRAISSASRIGPGRAGSGPARTGCHGARSRRQAPRRATLFPVLSHRFVRMVSVNEKEVDRLAPIARGLVAELPQEMRRAVRPAPTSLGRCQSHTRFPGGRTGTDRCTRDGHREPSPRAIKREQTPSNTPISTTHRRPVARLRRTLLSRTRLRPGGLHPKPVKGPVPTACLPRIIMPRCRVITAPRDGRRRSRASSASLATPGHGTDFGGLLP